MGIDGGSLDLGFLKDCVHHHAFWDNMAKVDIRVDSPHGLVWQTLLSFVSRTSPSISTLSEPSGAGSRNGVSVSQALVQFLSHAYKLSGVWRQGLTSVIGKVEGPALAKLLHRIDVEQALFQVISGGKF